MLHLILRDDVNDDLEHLFTTTTAETLGQIIADALPLDSLQQFAIAHAPCTLVAPGSLRLHILTETLGFTTLQAACDHCRLLTPVATPTCPRVEPWHWWLTLAWHAADAHPNTFHDPETETLRIPLMELVIGLLMNAIATALLVHAPCTEPALDGLLLRLDDDGNPLVLTH